MKLTMPCAASESHEPIMLEAQTLNPKILNTKSVDPRPSDLRDYASHETSVRQLEYSNCHSRGFGV